jgi:PPK2 family polyphosphate:nucleotide phosphotransferase
MGQCFLELVNTHEPKMKPMNPINWSDWRIADGKAFDLSRLPTEPQAVSASDKLQWPARMAELAGELNRLQAMLYASKTRGLLLILQGMDTSGKDGCIRTVFAHVSPLGVRAEAFGVPQAQEQRHDFLWRIHAKTPALGEMVIFNRSHYEDVLVPVVKGQLQRALREKRYHHIRHFESLLSDSGIAIVKCFLHISKDEQKKRLQARLDDPLKHWKVQASDFEDRRHWRAYMHAYVHAIEATSSEASPWYVVPADAKPYRDWMVAELLVDTLKSMTLRMPRPQLNLTDFQMK